MPPGQPTLYKPEYCEELVELRGQGMFMAEIARKWNVSKSVLHVWKEEHPEFLEAYLRAQEAFEGWYWEYGRKNMLDVSTKDESRRINDRIYKWIGYGALGLSERSVDSKANNIPPEFSNPKLSIHERQIACDVALVNKQISSAVHDSLTKCLEAQFNRENGLMIVKAQQDILNLSKKTAE